ncbi:MAG: alpha-amylase family glycosyl hydrolase, partial [Cyanobium sp.]
MSAAGPLKPRLWRLEQAPPGPGIPWPGEQQPLWESADPAHPALLLIDRRSPPAPTLQAELAASLSPAERRRLDGLRRSDDRERFLLGRAALRRLLCTWLERAPAAVPIECGPHGKPRCPGGPEFNVSHSGDLPDLDQSRPAVMERLKRHLRMLVDLGVDGFRFDAAKHIDPG